MRRIINDCYGCDSPSCAGCTRGKHEVDCCDYCGSDPEYRWGDDELCYDCIKDAIEDYAKEKATDKTDARYWGSREYLIDGEWWFLDELLDSLIEAGEIERI